MTALRLVRPMVAMVVFGSAALGDEPRGAVEHRLALKGTVVLPDGSPASGATVEAMPGLEERTLVAHTDREGRFELHGLFGNGARLHASSADGDQQATRLLGSDAVRSVVAAGPIVLKLAPASRRAVMVRAEGRPVEGAIVDASGTAFRVRVRSGPDGKAHLRLPADAKLEELVAWHPTLGVQGARDLDSASARDRGLLSLMPPAPLTIRVVDPEGKPVSGMSLGVSVRTDDSDWAVARSIEAAEVRTNDKGEAVVPWAPREKLKFVDPDPLDSGWKFDKVDLERLGDRLVTVQARRQVPVTARLVMPEGASAEGLLVTGFGFGPENQGDIPYARARADGSFTFRVPSNHGYVLSVVDREWVSEPWSGRILGKETEKPADIAISVRRAVPVTIRATRGKEHTPVPDAWVDFGRDAEVNWVADGGEKKSGRSSIGPWLRLDGNGEAIAGAGAGKYTVRLSAGGWNEERTIVVAGDRPVEVEFHRAWLGKRQIAGRLLLDGQPYTPSRTLQAHGWAPRGDYMPRKLKPEVNADGRFSVAFDDEKLVVLFLDPEKHRSGYAKLGPESDSLDVTMVPMASDSGVLLDEKGKPMAGQTLTLDVRDSGWNPVDMQRTDAAGRFRFPAVPADVPLYLWVGDGSGRADFFVRDNDRLFNPGEEREKDEAKVRRLGAPAAAAAAAPPTVPLGERVADVCANVRVGGMHALVVLQGDESKEIGTLIDQGLDEDRGREVWSYLPVRVQAAEVRTAAGLLKEKGWPVPAAGQIAIVALDGDGRTIAAETIASSPTVDAIARLDGFLKQHRPAARDALTLLTAARDEARGSGRRVWVVRGGPRCGPCFRLGRWMEAHHGAIEQDYVIVKVMDGLDTHADEVIRQFPESDRDGIPWFAITEPDGTVLVNSHGPLGNIGFPSSLEGRRHLRAMLARTARKLKAPELDALVQTLEHHP
jgi:hypothetical protein